MLTLIFSWLFLAVTIYVTALLVPGIRVTGVKGAAWVALLFGVVNWGLSWFLFEVLRISIDVPGLLTALFVTWGFNIGLLRITDLLTPSLVVRDLGSATVAALLIAVLVGAGAHIFAIPVAGPFLTRLF